jgi:predicted NBD/HSP70 family sugar kinase
VTTDLTALGTTDSQPRESRTAAPPVTVGVDVGGSKIAVVVADAADRIVGRELRPSVVGRQASAVADIADAVAAGLRDADVGHGAVGAIGVGVPGRVDPDRGTVDLAVNLGWHDLDLGPALTERMGIQVFVENDVRAAALGLLRRGVLGGTRDFAYLAIGTGISAGIVLDGRLHRGARGLAGEIGHLEVQRGGPACVCGQRGCLEAVAAGPAIARAATERGIPVTTAAELFALARTGDRQASELADDVGRWIAWAVQLLVLSLDLDRVVLGGGVASAGAPFLDPIRAAVDGRRAASPPAAQLLERATVELSPGGPDTGPWGAITVARESGPDAATSGRREVGHG